MPPPSTLVLLLWPREKTTYLGEGSMTNMALSRYLSSVLVSSLYWGLFTRFDRSFPGWALPCFWRPSLMFDFTIGRLDYGITLHSSSSEKLSSGSLKSPESCRRLFRNSLLLFKISLSLWSFYNLGVLLLTDSSYMIVESAVGIACWKI